MLRNILYLHPRILFFIFSSSISCGIVFFGILVGFGYMLGEQGVSPSTITSLFLATLPYSFKFAISPPIKNLITKFQKHGMKIIKIQAYILETIIFIGIALLGFYTKDSSYTLMFFHILILVLAGSIHDLLGDYLRLSYFKGNLLGGATSIGTIGFRIGMLFASAGILYLASFFGWKYAFIIISSTVFITFLSAVILKNENLIIEPEKHKIKSLKTYLKFCSKIFKEYGIIIILLLTFSFKFPDSSINGLKAIFLQTKGISKIDFANISQITGVFVMILAGAVATLLTYRYNIKKCLKYAFLMQIIPCCCFIYLSFASGYSFIAVTILLNASTFFLGFSTVIYRVYISKISVSDINIYTILLSIGSMFRSISLCIAGYAVDIFSWKMLYIICLLSNILGIFICFSKIKLQKQ